MGKKITESINNIYGWLELIFDIIWLCVLTLILCIPIITVGASLSALYKTCNKVIVDKSGYVNQVFFQAFRTNFKQATSIWLIYSIGLFLIQWNMGIVNNIVWPTYRYWIIAFYGLLLCLIIIASLYIFPLVATFKMDLGWYIKLSFYMIFKYGLTSIILAFMFVVCYLMAYYMPLSIIVSPGLYSIISVKLLSSKFQQHMKLEA